MSTFTLSTKPLKNAISLAIIDSNVNQFVQKSMAVQLDMVDSVLSITTEAAAISATVELHGSQNGDNASAIIDATLFKKFVATITAQQITLDFQSNCLVVRTDKSKYTIPKIFDTAQMSLKKPDVADVSIFDSAKTIDKKAWKFVKEHQLFARSQNTEMPVYTFVYAGDGGDILISDYKESIYTHSAISATPFTDSCLITDTIVNLFTAMPDGAKIVQDGDSYFVNVHTDGYDYVAQFTPQYENDAIGSYNAETIIPLFSIVGKPVSTVQVSEIKAMINQVSLLSNTRDNRIKCEVSADSVTFTSDNVNCVVPANGGSGDSYSLTLDFAQFKNIIASVPDVTFGITPFIDEDGDVAGIIISSSNLTIVVAGLNG